jgi:hypothetical protein
MKTGRHPEGERLSCTEGIVPGATMGKVFVGGQTQKMENGLVHLKRNSKRMRMHGTLEKARYLYVVIVYSLNRSSFAGFLKNLCYPCW